MATAGLCPRARCASNRLVQSSCEYFTSVTLWEARNASYDTHQSWHDKPTHKGFIRPDSGRCLRYYFYLLDVWSELIYVRVLLTWAPLRLQFYCNGRSWLARKFAVEGITPWPTTPSSGLAWGTTRELTDRFLPDWLHHTLDPYAERCSLVVDGFGQTYRRSPMQLNYAVGLVFSPIVSLGDPTFNSSGSRSSCSPTSSVLLLPCRLNFSAGGRCRIIELTTLWPIVASISAKWCRLAYVQRNDDIGAPRSSGSTSDKSACNSAGSVTASGLRPPPRRRTCRGSSNPSVGRSRRHRHIVLAATLVASPIAAMLP